MNSLSPRVVGIGRKPLRSMLGERICQIVIPISISTAVMKEAKVPTVMPPRDCHSAMQITTDSAIAASMWVSGVMAAEAAADLRASRRSTPLRDSKRRAWPGWAPCSRTSRTASTFSSTT